MKRRHFPDAPLGKPKKAFKDTFSAETVVMGHFFGETKREAKKAFFGYFAPLTWLWRKLRRSR